MVKLQVAQYICNWSYQKKGEVKSTPKFKEISTENFPILIKLQPHRSKNLNKTQAQKKLKMKKTTLCHMKIKILKPIKKRGS